MGMSKAMLEDYVKQVKKTLRIQRIVILVLVVLLALTFALAVSSFEIDIDIDQDTDIDYDVEQDGRQNTNTVTVNADNQTYIICGTIMVCVGIITTGVVAYGKTKDTYNYTQTPPNNDTEKKHIQ